MKKIKLGGLTILGLVIYLLLAYGSAETDTGSSSNNSTKIEQKNLELIDWKIKTGEYGNKYIVGGVRNNSDKEYSYVQIEFNLYNSNDIQVGSTMANVNNLEAHGKWKFKAVIMEDNATKAKFKNLTGY